MLPLRSKDALQKALPSLPGKFPTYRSFASSRLEDILDLKSLETAYKLEVNTLQSGVLLNDGQGRFTFHALSRLAQAAPASGAVLTELDGDSQADLCLAQNFYEPNS